MAAHVLELLRARLLLNGDDAKEEEEAAFVRNSCATYTEEEQPQVVNWLCQAKGFLQGNVDVTAKLQAYNIFLHSRTVFVGSGTTITLADLGMFVALRDSVAAVPAAEQEKLPNLFRWFDYVQNKDDVREVYPQVPIKKPDFNPANLSALDPNRALIKPPSTEQKVPDEKKLPENLENKQSPAKPKKTQEEAAVDGVKKDLQKEEPKQNDNPPRAEKEKKEKPAAQKKEFDCDVSVLDICVGQIKKVWKHPSADSLYVEEIDVGEAKPRQIVSGLVKFVPESDMLNRRVIVLLNIKPGKVRDVLSSGVVLCASNQDHSKCEPVSPPEVQVGERVKFPGHDGKPEEVLNPKKKQWEKIATELRTDSQGVAHYQGIPFQTSGGVCKSAIVDGSIK